MSHISGLHRSTLTINHKKTAENMNDADMFLWEMEENAGGRAAVQVH